jgi:hypothetical protein
VAGRPCSGHRQCVRWGTTAPVWPTRGSGQSHPPMSVPPVGAAAGTQAGLMEPFTLVIWLMLGQRLEEVQIPGMEAEAYLEQLFAIRADRGIFRGTRAEHGDAAGEARPHKC